MRLPLCSLILPAALFVCLPLAMALDEMSASAQGRGGITIQGQDLPVSRAEVSLIPGGRFIVSLHGEERYAFRGEWREQGNRVYLTVKEAQGAAAAGAGEIRLRSNRFRSIHIDGANRTFSADFTATGAYKDFTAGATTSDVIQAPVAPPVRAPRPGRGRDRVAAPVAPKAPAAPVAPKAPEAPALNPPKATVKGSGSLIEGRNERKEVDAMEVFLEPDGRVQLKTFGPAGQVVFRGKWTDGGQRAGQQRFNLSVTPGPGVPSAGRGYVLVDNDGHIDQVSVQGGSRVFRNSYNLTFQQR